MNKYSSFRQSHQFLLVTITSLDPTLGPRWKSEKHFRTRFQSGKRNWYFIPVIKIYQRTMWLFLWGIRNYNSNPPDDPVHEDPTRNFLGSVTVFLLCYGRSGTQSTVGPFRAPPLTLTLKTRHHPIRGHKRVSNNSYRTQEGLNS